MEATVTDIAATLRSTELMAAKFAERVQERVGEPVSNDEILQAMQKISAKRLSLDAVVDKVVQGRERQARQRTAGRRKSRPAKGSGPASPSISSKKPRTILEKLQATLQKNWDRAEAEGLHPERMSAKAFIDAVYQFTNRREATRQRILKAAQQLDQRDVLLTPALVADVTHELFEG